MIKGQSVLAVVSATSGCKTLARREMRLLAGKPLVLWTIEAARQSRNIDRLLVACDNAETASFLQAHNIMVSYQGPAKLKEDGVESLAECALTALATNPEFNLVVVLDAGSPLRLASDIDGAIEVAVRNHGTPVVTVSETRLSPDNLVVLDGARRMKKLFGNQDPVPASGQTRIYSTNNSIVVASQAYLKAHGTFLTEDTHAYMMPTERAIVVESKTDLAIAEGILSRTGPSVTAMPFLQEVSQSPQ